MSYRMAAAGGGAGANPLAAMSAMMGGRGGGGSLGALGAMPNLGALTSPAGQSSNGLLAGMFGRDERSSAAASTAVRSGGARTRPPPRRPAPRRGQPQPGETVYPPTGA